MVLKIYVHSGFKATDLGDWWKTIYSVDPNSHNNNTENYTSTSYRNGWV